MIAFRVFLNRRPFQRLILKLAIKKPNLALKGSNRLTAQSTTRRKFVNHVLHHRHERESSVLLLAATGHSGRISPQIRLEPNPFKVSNNEKFIRYLWFSTSLDLWWHYS